MLQKRHVPNLPLVIVPGLCSSSLTVVESPDKELINKRIRLELTSIGFDKVWDFFSCLHPPSSPLLARKRPNDSPDGGTSPHNSKEQREKDHIPGLEEHVFELECGPKTRFLQRG